MKRMVATSCERQRRKLYETYNGEVEIPETLEMRLTDSFENKDGRESAVECIAKFVNINYGHNQALLNNCKRLHDYSYFVACVREKLKKGQSLREAVAGAIDECLHKDILKDILLKHRAEVEGMFLTTFDKKMYEEAVRLDAYEEARRAVYKEAHAQGHAQGRTEGRAEEQANTARERQRAEQAEMENKKLREEIARLKKEQG